MKKISLIFAGALLVASTYINAQDDSREKIHFGAKAGLNVSSIYDTKGNDNSPEAIAGFVGGGFIAIPVGKYLGIQPEVLFAQKGFAATSYQETGTVSYTRRTDHLEIPVLLQIKPVSFLSLVVGPQFSYMTAREESFSSPTTTLIQKQEIENDNIRKNTLGITTGLDFYILRHLIISGRVGWDLQDNNGDGTSSFPRYRNVWMQGTVGLRF
ncbi:MAG TPA: porin family protein [Bacteroidia bacterium]|jgi:hypothetical protein|nr:porin family protein [Bacteroidia bacterium]